MMAVNKRKASHLEEDVAQKVEPASRVPKLESWRAGDARRSDHAAKHAPEKVKGLYKIMQRREKALGGGEGLLGVYGTITLNGMHTIIQGMKTNCSFSKESSLIDVGSGLGRPLLHAMVDPGVSDAWGIEVDDLKCKKADAFIDRSQEEARSTEVCLFNSRPSITCSAVEEVKTFNPFTHAFSFWEGVPQNGKAAFGRSFRKANTMQGVAVVQRAFRKDPSLEMRKLGFGLLLLVDMVKVKMSGSGRSFIAYIFMKPEQPPVSVLEIVNVQRLSIPEAGNAFSKKKKVAVNGEESQQIAEKIVSLPVAYGTRSRKEIDWARRRDIRGINCKAT